MNALGICILLVSVLFRNGSLPNLLLALLFESDACQQVLKVSTVSTS
jgi:hypothetical protein